MTEKEKPTSTVEEPNLSGTYTAADYLQWQLDEMVELIRGKIFKMSPSPSTNHQRISREMQYQIHTFFLKESCEVFDAPFDVYLVHPGEDYKKTRNVVEPDLCVICDPSKIVKHGCIGPPDLVVEILSPSTSQKDQKDKFELYEEYGVKEYWIVSPENRSVITNVLEDRKFKTFRPVTEAEKLQSHSFPGLEIDLVQVFKDLTE